MRVSKCMKQRKRPLSNEEEEGETSCKKRRDETTRSQEAVNGLDLPRPQKVPRLSPALFCEECEVSHIQLHQFLKYAVIGKRGNAAQASWCSIHHQKRLRGVVVVVLQDLAQHHFYQYYLHFHSLRTLFRHRFSLPPPRSSFIASLLGLNDLEVPAQKMDDQNNTEGSPDQKCNCHAASHDPILQKYGRKRHGLTRYLLTEEEMRKNGYPFVDSDDTENYVHTNCTKEPTDSSPLFGLDCEMCLTRQGNELTRVSLVDAQGHCIMDELVKPDNPIIDYMTRFSGITKDMLLGVNTNLKEVQEKLRSLLPPDAVLVGHSLNYDLRALQMIHPNVIDTSLLFARDLEKRYKLRFLAEAILHRRIQCTDDEGHNPSEDAAAALNLAQYFIQHGPEKVADINLEDVFLCENNPNRRPVNRNVPENGFLHPLPSEGPSFLELLDKTGQKITYVSRGGLKCPLPSGAFATLLCSSNDEVLQKACSVVPLSPVSVVQFHHEGVFNPCSVYTSDKFADMMTVFAGPFTSGVCLKSVKVHFESCGPIHSLSTVSETHQPYICIKYSVPEAAQLAVELLNGSCINGCPIKVQRMITRQTLDYEDIFKEMEEDPENKNTIYVSGFARPLTERFLLRRFKHLKGIRSIFAPKNPTSRQYTKYCYLKFHSPDAAAEVVERIQTHGGLRSRKAITFSHLHHWLQEAVTCIPVRTRCNKDVLAKEDHTEIIKDLDRKIQRLYERAPENTLCVILFPGNNSSNGSVPGFGLMGIKC